MRKRVLGLSLVMACAALLALPGAVWALVDVSGWKTVLSRTLPSSAAVASDQGRVVWTEGDPSGASRVMLYDASTAQTRVVVASDPSTTISRNILIDGDQVVYETYSESGGGAGIFLYDLAAGQGRRVNGEGAYPGVAGIAGNQLAWWQRVDASYPTTSQVMLYDIATGTSTVLSETGNPMADPSDWLFVDPGWVVWKTFSPQPDDQLWAYSAATKEKRALPGLVHVKPQALVGDTLYYVLNDALSELRAYDLVSGTDRVIATNSQEIQSARGDAEHLAWASTDAAGSYIDVLDLATLTTTRLPSPAYQVGQLVLKGNLLIWRGETPGRATVPIPSAFLFAYDLRSGTVTRLSSLQSTGWSWDTDGKVVVIQEDHRVADAFVSELAVSAPVPAGGLAAFADVPGTDPYWTPIRGLQESNAVAGYPAASGAPAFRPDASLTRGQFAKMLVLGLGLPTSGDYVGTLVSLGILKGTGTGQPDPYGVLSRAQMVSLVVRAADQLRPQLLAAMFGIGPSYLGAFDPVHAENMQRAQWGGLLDGVVGYGASWSPWQAASRGEAAQVIWNLASWRAF